MKKWLKAFLVGALALGPVAAQAAIDNTHHDVPYLNNAITEKCAYCHSKTNVTATAAGLGKVGGFCIAVCHLDGSGISGDRAQVVPTSPGLFNTANGTTFTMTGTDNTVNVFRNGHKMDKTNMATLDQDEGPQVTLTGWPYTNVDELQCTSCHSVHDATNPPFLNAKLSDGTQTGGFCQRCHNNAIRQQTLTTTGNHPIEFDWDPTVAATRGTSATTKTDGNRFGNRELAIPTTITNLNVTATGVTPTTVGSLNGTGANWNLGGHVVNTTTGLPTAGNTTNDQFGCYSCHPVHAAATSATGEYGSILVAGGSLSTVCMGCHTLEPGTTGYGHPIYPETTLNSTLAGWDAIPLTAGYTGLGAPILRSTTAGAAPYCVSCHDVHNGMAGRMAIRSSLGTLNADGAVCELCHSTSFANPTTANQHHPGGATNYTGSGFATNLGWVTRDGLGDLDDGLSCGDCHVGDGNTAKRSTAHNWQ